MMNQAVETSRGVRRLPRRYGIIDQRIVSEGYLKRLTAEAVSLYVFLCVVADRSGRSWYSDGRLVKSVRLASLADARRCLVETKLISWDPPVYTVLEVPELVKPVPETVTLAVDGPPATPEDLKRLNALFRERMGWNS